ncbi:MAG: hypothetical protein NT015_07110 [Alphaproteobacteria bacterium]|nr:hypothetical protein [Alphaproteobacteria bacterium]
MTDLVAPAVADDEARLPEAVRRLARVLGAEASSQGASLTQAGRMKLSINAKNWTRFTARQTIATRACGFDWRARMGPFGVIAVQDALIEGRGKLSVNALGIAPLARATPSDALTRSELMRYLAELAWAPDTIRLNTALRWREIDARTLSVSAGIGAAAAEVFFTLGGDGTIAGGYALDRPRSLVEPFLPTRWTWRYSDYRRCEGRFIPFAGEVAWEIEGKELVYWQGRLTGWHA